MVKSQTQMKDATIIKAKNRNGPTGIGWVVQMNTGNRLAYIFTEESEALEWAAGVGITLEAHHA